MSVQLPEGAKKLIARSEVDSAIERMAVEIEQFYGSDPVVMLTIMNGGMLIAAALSQRLNLPLSMDYLHATRYRNETGGDQLNWLARPRVDLQGQHVLIVDDILDEGYTLAGVEDYCRDQQAKSVESAVLVKKNHDRCKPGVSSRFVGIEADDVYLFGWGMDYRGQLRHLPDIYGLVG